METLGQEPGRIGSARRIRFIERFDRYPRRLKRVLGWGALFVVVYVDYATGPDLSFLIFYFFPIFIFAWGVGRRAANVMAVVSGIAWILADALTRDHYSHPLVPYWNLCIKIMIFLVIANVLSELKRVLDLEKSLARLDALTGVANRRSFMETAIMEMERLRRYGRPLTLAYVDVDEFKGVNDRGGHKLGDTVLRESALAMKRAVRRVDLVARMGGDEFAILLPEAAPESAKEAMQKVKQALVDLCADRGWTISFSIGVTSFVNCPESVDQLIHLADELMYSVKKSGKNSVAYRTV